MITASMYVIEFELISKEGTKICAVLNPAPECLYVGTYAFLGQTGNVRLFSLIDFS